MTKDGKCCDGHKWIIASIPVFIFFSLSEYVIHEIWLMPLYESSSHLWRSEAFIRQHFSWVIGYQAILAVLITALYHKCHRAKIAASSDEEKECPRENAICFGVLLGLLLGAMHSANYIWMPLPFELAVNWLIAAVIQGTGIGVVLSLVYGRKHDK